MSTALPAGAGSVLDYWFAPEGDPAHGGMRKFWFRKSAATDQEIADRFKPLIELALRGELAGWAADPRSALAQIIVLDQFTRNVFRDTPRAFAGDAQALSAARTMVGTRQDEALAPVERSFVYLPFEHAESSSMQDESVRLFTRLEPLVPGGDLLEYAELHRGVIARFGRFPHRNAILGRASTALEIEFIAQPGSRF